MIFLIKSIGGIIAMVILVPLVVSICLPYLLLVDRDEYWASFWWRTKRLASATANIASIIGASAAS